MNHALGISSYLIAAPMLALLAASLVPVMLKVFSGNREPHPFVTTAYGFIAVASALGLAITFLGGSKFGFHKALVSDGLALWASIIVLVSGAFSIFMMHDHVETQSKLFSEKVFLLLGSLIGMLIVVLSNDLIVTFLGIETMSLCLYVLIAMSRETVLSKEAAFKYFVLGSFASAIFLYGIALIYGTAGTTQFPGLMEQVGPLLESRNHLFLIGIIFVVLGFAFKVSVFPFHFWTPDVYQGAPTPVTAFMATAVKAATFVAILRLFQSTGYQHSVPLKEVISWLAALTMLVGNAAAIMQPNFKRMLAYSSVAHSGYLMVGVVAAGFGDSQGVASAAGIVVLFYLLAYSIMTLGSFAFVALLEKSVGQALQVDDVRGLGRTHPVLAGCMAIVLFSLAGVPPLLGFFGKFGLFSLAIEQNFYWLAIWGVLNSVVSVYYYLRPIVLMYMQGDDAPHVEMNKQIMTRFTLFGSAILIIVMGLFSSPILSALKSAILGRS